MRPLPALLENPALPMLALLLLLPGAAEAQRGPPPRPQEVAVPSQPGALLLEAGAGRVVTLPAPAASLFAADPKVAEVRPASPTSLFVFGVAPGRTTIAAMDAAGQPLAQYQVMVRPGSFGAEEAQASLARLLPGRALRVEARPGGLALTGSVAQPAEAEQAASLVRGFLAAGQSLDNRLSVEGPAQVNLRVRVAEVSREVTRQFGLDWQAMGSIGRFAISALTNNSLADPTNLPGRYSAGYTGAVNLNGIIDALAQDRLINVLAEPNLTALSGETASFLVGGEFPIPVGRRYDQISIEFKQYGISLAFVPTVMQPGRISLRVRPEVSELSEQGAIRLSADNSSLQIPALTVRRAETTIELGSGQSFAIAGLMQDSQRTTGRAVPWMGEVPVLGALFRSDRFQRSETELVIAVTPYLVRPVSDPAALRSPAAGQAPADDAERILLFRQFARRDAPPLPPPPGDAGFILR
ncbi:type II and III secretion system protein family protein [Roseomonas sp. 18066]|uniref:type II and III secretion system protein family protein n=1 Tax=Roseomonas sp. 18066 TaxID=2681412 RepID=UPI00135C0062|nr:type II and III secretion system protein family protein [Roseomonas sp. 18066]